MVRGPGGLHRLGVVDGRTSGTDAGVVHHVGAGLQKLFGRPAGEIYARTDLWIEARQTVGEFDGKVTYGRGLYEQSGDLGDVDLGAVLFAEKRREDDIRTDGAEVVRWTWSELDGHDRTIRGRFEAAFARAARRRPAG